MKVKTKVKTKVNNWIYYVDINIQQTVPASSVNSDDHGNDNTAVNNGVRRARVSSQYWKHALRKAFTDMNKGGNKDE